MKRYGTFEKLEKQNKEMLDKLKRFTGIVKEYDLNDDQELLIEMELFIEKIDNS